MLRHIFLGILLVVFLSTLAVGCGGGGLYSGSVITGVTTAGEGDGSGDAESGGDDSGDGGDVLTSLPVASLSFVTYGDVARDLDGSEPVPTHVKFAVSFDRAITDVEKTAIEAGFSFGTRGVPVSVVFAWADDAESATITPQSRLSNAVAYDVLIASSAASGASSTEFTTARANDVNGDGYDDIVVGAMQADSNVGYAFVFFGSDSSGVVTTCDLTDPCDAGTWIEIVGPGTPGNFGASVAIIGDVNADGYADMAFGADDPDSHGGIYIMPGSSNLASCEIASTCATLDATIRGAVDENVGESFAGAGDVNGDGYDDFIFGVPSSDSAYILEGSSGGLSDCTLGDVSESVTTLVGAEGASSFGASVVGNVDLNADGVDDIAVSAEAEIVDAGGAVYVFYGVQDNGIADCNIIDDGCSEGFNKITGAESFYLGSYLAGIEKSSSDGFDALLVGASGHTRSHIFNGSASGISDCVIGDCSKLTISGASIAGDGIGDVNNDGYSDVMVSDTTADGALYVYYGPFAASVDELTISGDENQSIVGTEDSEMALGSSISGAGDVNNDGYVDVAVSANGFLDDTHQGKVFVYNGDASGLAGGENNPSPNSTITGASSTPVDVVE